MWDYLLIGQGLAGALLAYFLRADGHEVAVLDDAQPRGATRVAAGLINPVTGRHFVKSWRIDELLPFARSTYRALESELDVPLYHERTIIRALHSIEEENNWLGRCADPGYRAYISDEAGLGAYGDWIVPPHGFGAVKGGAQVEVGTLINKYREVLESEGCLFRESIDYTKLILTDDGVRYGNIQARQLVFCEGHWTRENPFFQSLPLIGDKGEILIVRFPAGVQFDAILKHRVFVVPLADSSYWIGSNYDSRFESDAPTEQGRGWLEQNLRRTLTCPFEVLAHRAAIRPTVRDRRPLLGRHPQHAQLAIFNGLGAKGASLGPFWARHFADYLQEKTTLDPMVDIGRFSGWR